LSRYFVYKAAFGGDARPGSAWKHLIIAYHALVEVDMVCFTLAFDGWMEEIVALLNSAFAAPAMST